MVASAVKKKSARSSKPREDMLPKSHFSTHPPWTDMITVCTCHHHIHEHLRIPYQECITTTPEGTRDGVSRPAIKKVGFFYPTVVPVG
jgi:histone H1/5